MIPAMVCLGAYLLGGASVLPGVAALVARLDAGHAVSVSVTEGHAQIVLRHASASQGARQQGVSHHHGVACALLCAVWADSGRGPDHVLNFRAAGVSEAASEQELVPGPPAGKSAECLWQNPLGMAYSDHFDGFARPAGFSFVTRALAPPMSSSLPLLRSVTLLI